MTITNLHKYQSYALFFMILFLPLHGLPKAVHIPFVGGNVSNWFLLIALGLLAYEYVKYRFEIPRKALIYFTIYIAWQLLCLAFGLLSYEYNSYLTIGQIPRLEFLMQKLQNFGVVFDELLTMKFWLFLRYSKNIFLFNNIILVIAFLVWHLYKDDFNKGFVLVRKAVIFSICLMGLYSVVEMAWLKFGSKTAEEILCFINPLLYDIETTHGWWPPLLWNNGLRSLTMEPSFLGLISIFMLPILWSTLFNKGGHRLECCFLIFYFSFMIAATNARTAIVATGIQLVLLIISTFFVRNKKYTVTVLVIALLSASAFSLNLVNFKNNDFKINVNKYVENNITSVTKTNVRSNNARLGNLLANINVIKEHPIMGVGTGLKDAYMQDRFPENYMNNREIANWRKYLREQGPLKAGFPGLNKFADVAIQNGLVGLFLYILPVIYIFLNLFKYRKQVAKNCEVIVLIISMLGLLAAHFSNAGFMQLNAFVWGLLFCWINEVEKEKLQVDNVK